MEIWYYGAKVVLQLNERETMTTETTLSHSDWAKVIDQSALESRLYHFNGGQAYLRAGVDNKELLVVDMTLSPTPTFNYYQGEIAETYFANNDPYWISKTIAENPLASFYANK